LCPILSFLPKHKCLVYSLTSFPSLSINFSNFFHNISYVAWTTSSFNCKHPLMCVQTSHWPYGHPPFMLCSWQRMHWNPWCNLRHLCCHCARCWFPCETRIITCASFNHIQLLSLTNWHCAYKDDIHTLVDIVIANPTWMDLFPRFCATQGFITFNITQGKKRNYCNWHPIDQFLPLTIEIFGCLHKHVDMVFTRLPQCHLELEKVRRLSSFFFNHFSL